MWRVVNGATRGFTLKTPFASGTTNCITPPRHEDNSHCKTKVIKGSYGNFYSDNAVPHYCRKLIRSETDSHQKNSRKRYGYEQYERYRFKQDVQQLLYHSFKYCTILGLSKYLIVTWHTFKRNHNFLSQDFDENKCFYLKSSNFCKKIALCSRCPRENTLNKIHASPVTKENPTVGEIVFENLLESSKKSVYFKNTIEDSNDINKNKQEFSLRTESLDEFTSVSRDCVGASFNVLGLKCWKRRDFKNAVEYFRNGSDVGYAKAQFNLGACYELGIGVRKDLEKAKKLYSKAAWNGHTIAQYNLGLHLSKSKQVSQVLESIKLLEMASASGLVKAQSYLGWFLTNEGIHKDLKTAVKMFEMASEQGDNDSMYHLGVCYEQGLGGLKKDLNKAHDLYTTAASKGNIAAHFNLAVILESELAGKKCNPRVVRKLYQFAADKGHEPSIKRLKQLDAYDALKSKKKSMLTSSKTHQDFTIYTTNKKVQESKNTLNETTNKPNMKIHDKLLNNLASTPTFYIGSGGTATRTLDGISNYNAIDKFDAISKFELDSNIRNFLSEHKQNVIHSSNSQNHIFSHNNSYTFFNNAEVFHHVTSSPAILATIPYQHV